jgi:sulfite exporter TauE/SafE
VTGDASWLAAAALTFAASAHCLGMCGGFALALQAPRRACAWGALGSHLLLQLGKGASYAFLGALAGAFGAALLSRPAFVWGARGLALAAGALLVAAGLTLLGLRAARGGAATALVAPHLSRLMGPLLQARPRGAGLVVGLLMGFLPCPLVYAGLAAAAASGSAAQGALILAGVALGTLPALGTLAVFGGLLGEGARRTLARAAGVLLLAVGVITLLRAFDLHAGHGAATGAVPAQHHHH